MLSQRVAQDAKLSLEFGALRSQLKWKQADLDWIWEYARPPYDERWQEKPTLEQAREFAKADLKAFLLQHPEYEADVSWWRS